MIISNIKVPSQKKTPQRDPDDTEDFENLDPELQDLVESGEIDMYDARELGGCGFFWGVVF